jgi:XTP/dITP diphosphohydrolase
MNIVFATQNQNKAEEIQKLLPTKLVVKSLSEIGCDEDIPETAPNLEGNASLKSQYVAQKFGMNCFADDTGLEIEALNGEPGVYSARYAGDQKDSNDNMDLVLEKLKDESNRKAQFRTVISLRMNSEEVLFEGIVKGNIRSERSGVEGFGYDPIFEPEGFDVTFAEMSIEDKNKISHRGKAVQKLIAYLNNV